MSIFFRVISGTFLGRSGKEIFGDGDIWDG